MENEKLRHILGFHKFKHFEGKKRSKKRRKKLSHYDLFAFELAKNLAF